MRTFSIGASVRAALACSLQSTSSYTYWVSELIFSFAGSEENLLDITKSRDAGIFARNSDEP